MAVEGIDAEGLRRSRLRIVRVALAICAALLTHWLLNGGWPPIQDALDDPDASEPSCSWSAHIEGADADQTGLIRCYLRAVAHHSDSELRAVVPSRDDSGPTGFSAPDFAHSHDAAAGPATVTVAANDADSADASVTISYTDGEQNTLEIHRANPSSSHSWRFVNIGTYPSDPDQPSPAVMPS
jgi:hypothetical protein